MYALDLLIHEIRTLNNNFDNPVPLSSTNYISDFISEIATHSKSSNSLKIWDDTIKDFISTSKLKSQNKNSEISQLQSLIEYFSSNNLIKSSPSYCPPPNKLFFTMPMSKDYVTMIESFKTVPFEHIDHACVAVIANILRLAAVHLQLPVNIIHTRGGMLVCYLQECTEKESIDQLTILESYMENVFDHIISADE